MRSFIAVPLTSEARSALERIQSSLRRTGADVRWTAVGSMHLTLKFLGEIDPALAPRLAESLGACSAGITPFTLQLRGLGGFPNLRSPRVIWCGIAGDTDTLGVLQGAVESACTALGFAPEQRPFSPHLTLGRVNSKTNLQPLLDYIKIGSGLEQTIPVDRFNLYKSVLTPKGPIYTVLNAVELRGRPGL